MTEGLVLLLLLILLILVALPVSLAMALSGIIGILVFAGSHVLPEAGRIMWWSNYSWLMVAIPFFLIMAEFMGRGRLADRMFQGLTQVTAGIRGSLAIVVVTICALMGLSTGGGVTEIAAIGRLSIPEMLKRGYDERLTAGSIAAASALGFLVPPSIFLVIYGAWGNYSVAELFAAGLVPGFVTAFLMIATVVIRVRINPRIAPISPPVPLKLRVRGLATVWPLMLLGSVVLGLIFKGVATPTEVAGLGAVLALSLVLAIPVTRKNVNWAFFKESLSSVVRLTAVIMFIITGAQILAYAWGYLGVPGKVANWVLGMPFSPIWILMMVYFILLVAGMIMDAISVLVLSLPVLLPIVTGAGFDPIWFGVVMGLWLAVAQITPPVGMALFTVRAISPERSFATIVWGALPYLGAEVGVVALLTAFPAMALWLPNLMYQR